MKFFWILDLYGIILLQYTSGCRTKTWNIFYGLINNSDK